MFESFPRNTPDAESDHFVVHSGYGALQFGMVPPSMFAQSLRTAWRGGKPALATWICLSGLAVWGLLVSVVALVVITTWTQ